jgi:hypothetical protein
MKFSLGDYTDVDQCAAMEDEILRCRDAFNIFEMRASLAILRGQDPWLSRLVRHAYVDFVRCLYEFLHGAHNRETGNTKIAEKERDELYILAHAQRLLTKMRLAIQNGTAPYANDISQYPEKVPPEFAESFRSYRLNFTHVTHKRPRLAVSDFYEKYHRYLLLLYHDCCRFIPPDFVHHTMQLRFL